MVFTTGSPSEEALSQLIQSLINFLEEEQQFHNLTVPEAAETVNG